MLDTLYTHANIKVIKLRGLDFAVAILNCKPFPIKFDIEFFVRDCVFGFDFVLISVTRNSGRIRVYVHV